MFNKIEVKIQFSNIQHKKKVTRICSAIKSQSEKKKNTEFSSKFSCFWNEQKYVEFLIFKVWKCPTGNLILRLFFFISLMKQLCIQFNFFTFINIRKMNIKIFTLTKWKPNVSCIFCVFYLQSGKNFKRLYNEIRFLLIWPSN